MLGAAAVCPATPLLVPAIAAGAAGELADLRAACLDAVRSLSGEVLVVVGDGPETLAYRAGDRGSFDRYGVDLDVVLGPRVCAGQPVLPPSLTVGAWLVREAGWSGDVQGLAVGPDADPAAAGAEAAAIADRVAVLVMADGSAKRSDKAPGAYDPRAAEWDAGLARALAAADVAALRGLDPGLAAELWCAGCGPLRALAGAAAEGGPWTGEVGYDAAPYGVGYLVATWR